MFGAANPHEVVYLPALIVTAVWGVPASGGITDQAPYFGKIWVLSSIQTYAYVTHMIP